MAKRIRKLTKKQIDRPEVNVDQQHITRRIGAHQRSTQKRAQASKRARGK